MKKLTTVILIFAIFLGGILFWWNSNISAVNTADKTQKGFVVAQGAGVREIANNLQKEGLIRNSVAFFLLVKQLGLDNKIQAGSYQLSPSMDARHIAEALTHGSLDLWITIPEGKRAEEIAAILKDKLPSYDESWITELKNHEGYLFPDTYLVPKDASVEAIIVIMKENFDKKYAEVEANKQSKLSKDDIVTMASLIEREAITDAEKSIIAGILMNRLSAEMPLQVDATIQYAKGQNSFNKKWWEPVTLAEYKSVRSAYNTYLNLGLPPGPISNPGIEALKAAANPTDTEYVYYIHDKNGTIRYAKTLDGHDANIRKYGL